MKNDIEYDDLVPGNIINYRQSGCEPVFVIAAKDSVTNRKDVVWMLRDCIEVCRDVIAVTTNRPLAVYGEKDG